MKQDMTTVPNGPLHRDVRAAINDNFTKADANFDELYAKDEDFFYLDDLQALREYAGIHTKFYIKGHTAPGDGGGGPFVTKSGQPAGTYVDDNAITVVPTGGDGSNARVRNSDTINFKCAGANGTVDDTAAIIACLKSGKEIRDFTGSTYIYTSKINVVGFNVRLATNCNFVGPGIKLGGSLTTLTNLSGVVARGGYEIPVTSPDGINPGDFIILHNTVEFSFSAQRSYYTNGEHCIVAGKVGSVIYLENPLRESYPSGAAVIKLESKDIDIDGGFYFSEAAGNALEVYATIGARIKADSVTLSGVGSSSALSINKCYGAIIDGGRYHKEYDSVAGTTYGVLFNNSSRCVLRDAIVFGGRHAVATGGDATAGSIPNCEITVKRCKLYNDKDHLLHCADFHGNTLDSRYIDCEVHGGYGIGGKNNKAIGGTVYEKVGHTKPALMYTELASGCISFNSLKYVCMPGNTSSHLLTNSTSTDTMLITDKYTVAMRNIQVVNCPSTKTMVMNAFDNCAFQSSWVIDSIAVDGDLSGFTRVIGWTGTNGITVQPRDITVTGVSPDTLLNLPAIIQAGVALTCPRKLDRGFERQYDKTVSRAINTTYTNTEGKSITVSLYAGALAPGTGSFLLDGVQIASSNTCANVDHIASVQGIIVPNGSTYRFSFNGTLQKWMEAI